MAYQIVAEYTASASGRKGYYTFPAVECIDKAAPVITMVGAPELAADNRSAKVIFTSNEPALLSHMAGLGYVTEFVWTATSNAEKELPDAFLRRCIFHYIDFPNEELMEEIIKTHYPNVEENLMKNAMSVFYDIRTIRDIRKKPSTSELIDWINALQIGGISADTLRAKLPFVGVVVKKDEDLEIIIYGDKDVVGEPIKIIDVKYSDVLVCEYEGVEQDFHLMGIYSPFNYETEEVKVDGLSSVEYITSLLKDKEATIVFDHERYDEHDCLQGYIFLKSGEMLNGLLIGKGYNKLIPSDTDYIYQEEFEKLDDEKYILIATPSFLKRTVEIEEKLCMKDPWIFTSGGAVSEELAVKTEKVFGFCPLEVYGSTETSGIAYRQQNVDGLKWTPFDNAKIWLGDDGCLRIISPYIKNPEGFATADLADIQPDGRFFLKGRSDSIVKIEEKRISLPEVENRIMQSGLVSEVKVVALANEVRQFLAAAIVLNQEGKIKFQDTEKYLINRWFHDYLMQFFENVVLPKKWRFLDKLPCDVQGKVHKNEIIELFEKE